MRSTPPTDVEQFCSEVEQCRPARPILNALVQWGLADVQTMVLLYLYAHGQSWPEDPDPLWIASAADMQRKMANLAKRLRRFHKLPGSIKYIASLKENAAAMERPLSWRSYSFDAPPTVSSISQINLVPLSSLAVALSPGDANSIERLPQILEGYATLLRIKSARKTASKKLVKSRVLYLLFLAIKRAESSKSDYQAYKSLAELLTAIRPEGEIVDYKTVGNRVSRYKEAHPAEAEEARSVVAKSAKNGVLKLVQLVESQRGFLLYSED